MSKQLTLDELKILLQKAENEVPTKSIWRHYRDCNGEKLYTITGHAIAEHDESVVVLYTHDQQVVFSRPLTEFIETVQEGTQKRFQKIS